MKAKLSAKNREIAQELHDNVARVFKRCERDVKEIEKYSKVHDEVNARIAKAESSLDPADGVGVAELTAMREQRRLCAERVQDVSSRALDRQNEVVAVLGDASCIVGRILQPAYEGYIAEITAAFRPYYGSASEADVAAKSCTAAQSVLGILTRSYGTHASAAFKDAEHLLALLERILNGEEVWTFNQNMTTEAWSARYAG